MRAKEFILESRGHPCIVVDVQPEYCKSNQVCLNVIRFVNQQTGPVLMFVNAELEGLTSDTVYDIKEYWEDWGFDPTNWNRVEIVDKGYGYLRSWMDNDMPDSAIIRTIRAMYQQRVTDSRSLFDGEYSEDYLSKMVELVGVENQDFDFNDPLIVEWTSISQLKRFNGAYIMGGGRNECLREVELLMNAFNIKYKRIDSLVYGN